jgi:3D (Asp-Asp-Asp) domain-containing protein
MRTLFIILFLIPQSVGNIVVQPFNEVVVNKEPILPVNKEKVILTIYKANSFETDSTPNITASGFKIDTTNPDKHKIIAVSRDLKRKGWKFGKKVRVKKAGKYNGVYTIRDLMNKRHKNRIDILVGEDHSPVKLRNVEITLID